MTPYVADSDLTIYVGDALQVLRELPDESVDCVVTSPPYWGLRDYGTGEWEGGDQNCDHQPPKQPARKFTNGRGEGQGDEYAGSNLKSWTDRDGTTYRDVCGKCGATRVDQQLGLEPTPDQYVTRIVQVFREARRVLAKHGTCWVNLGDSYAGGGGGNYGDGLSLGQGPKHTTSGKDKPRTPSGLKPKDLVGIPWRVAFALQADGWTLRSDIVWGKPNPMPESVTDRPTKAHEMVFLLAKSPWIGPPRGQYADISDEDARWLALLFDTEGNIVIKKAQRGDRTQYGAQMAFANCSRALLERARDIVGAGSIHERAGTNASVFYWQMTGRQARDLLYRIYPHLIVKQRQAKVAIHMQDVVAEPKKRPGGYRTEEHAAFLDRCWQTVKSLNQFGDPDLSWVPEPRYGRWGVARYWFDQEAVREPHTDKLGIERFGTTGGRSRPEYEANTQAWNGGGMVHKHREYNPSGRNIRSVWEIATQPYPEAHFATFPEELARRCILAGCPERVCRVCGKPSERIVDVSYEPTTRTPAPNKGHVGAFQERAANMTRDGFVPNRDKNVSTLGWTDCGHNQYRPGVVLDPFLGSGTVALVARNHGRHAIGIELSAEYAELAAKRTRQLSLLAEGAS